MPAATTPRPPELDSLTPHDAATAVSDFIAPQSSGKWTIKPFSVDDRAAGIDALRSLGDGGGRYTPSGNYLMLHEGGEGEDAYSGPMMSNTPDEIIDHSPIFDYAEGRVLVTGLGLSCVVSGLLTKPEVTHIDVVELDPDVIKMVGPAYAEEDRVTIHEGNALTIELPNLRWDYAWHDIWATISDKNLDPEDAEYGGLTYRKLFERYAGRADRQMAWAFDMALSMREAARLADEEAERWNQRWANSASADERRTIQIEWHSRSNPVLDALGVKLDAAQMANLMPDFDEQISERAEEASDLKFWVDSEPFLPEARERLGELRDAEYESYGYVSDDVGFLGKESEVRF